jgi:hypothetical protein
MGYSPRLVARVHYGLGIARVGSELKEEEELEWSETE